MTQEKKNTSKARSYDIERVRVRRRNKGWKGRGNCLKKGRGKQEGNEKKKYRKGKGQLRHMGKCVKEEKWRVRNYETRGKDKVRERGYLREGKRGVQSIEHGIRKRKTEGKEGDAWKNKDEEVK